MFDLSLSRGEKEDEEKRRRGVKFPFSSDSNRSPIISQGPRISALPQLKMSRREPIEMEPAKKASTWEQIKAGDIKGIGREVGLGLSHGLSKLGSARQDVDIATMLTKNTLPGMADLGRQQLVRQQQQREYLEANPATSLPAILGEEIPKIPLWMVGEGAIGALGKGIGKLSPRIASTAEKVGSRVPSFVKGGLMDAATYGGVISPVDNIREGGSFQDLIEKEKQLPMIALGGIGARGAIKGIGKAADGARSVLSPRGVPLFPIESAPLRTQPLTAREPISTRLQQEVTAPRIELPQSGPLDRFSVKPDQRLQGSSVPAETPRIEPQQKRVMADPKSYKISNDTQSAVDEISAKMDKRINDIAMSNKQMDTQTPIETTRKKILDMGGIKQGNGDIFEEQKVIPNWIRNDTTGRPLDEVADTLGVSTDELLKTVSSEKFKPKNYMQEAQAIANKDPEYMALSNTLEALKSELPGKKTLSSIPKLKPRELQTTEIPKAGDSVDAPIGNKSMAANIESPSATLRLDVPEATPIGQPKINERQVGAEPVIPEGLKESGVAKNIRTDANRPDELRDMYSADPLAYQQLGNKETLAKAQSIFDKGIEPAIDELEGLIKDIKPEAAPLVKMIADKLIADGQGVRAKELLSNAANRAVETGQFGQAFRILRDADPETLLMTFGKQLKKLNKEGSEQYGKKWKDVDLTPDEITMVGNIERGNQASYDSAFEQIQARIADEMPATAMEKINAWRHISMLLNVKSNVRNIGGNAIMMAMRKAAQRTSGVIQKVFLKESDRTQSVFIDKVYKDLAKEYVEANSKEILGGANKFQEGIALNMPDKRVFRKSRIAEAFGKDVDILEKTRKFNYSLLQKGDTPFFRRAYEDRLASYAQAKGIKDFSKLPQDAFDIARQEAMEATYKDSSIIADFLNKAKRPAKDAGIARKTGAVLTEAVIPFAKTPLNVLKRGLQFSPIGVANGLGSIKSSKGAAAAIDELAKGLTGTGVLGLGYLLAEKGILTGKVSKDADMRAYDSSAGHSPFSVLGKFSFDWAAPLSIPLSVGVEIYNSVKDSPEDKAKMDSVVEGYNLQKLGQLAANASEAILEGMNASGDVVFNMSIFKGVKTLLGGQQGVMEGFSKLPQGYATQFIPTTLGQIAGSVDPLVRQTYVKGDIPQSFKNALTSKIPLASTKLPAKQTPFGEDMKKIENPIGRAFSQFLSPGTITKDQGIDPSVDAELRRLNEVEGLKTQFPTMVPNYIEKTQTHPRITLTPEETSEYQKRVGELTLSSFIKTIGSGSYLRLKPIKAKGKSADEVKADLLAEKIADAKALAKKEILKSRGLK